MPDEPKTGVTDLVGIEPLAKSIEIATQGAVDAAAAFFGRLCMPAIKELGLFAKDKVHAWRTHNGVALAQKTEAAMKANGLPDGVHSHPRIFHEILERASWIDDSTVQDLWAGLLASSCTETGDDDSNLLFTNLLGTLTKLQAKILKYACEKSEKKNFNGLILSNPLAIPIRLILELFDEKDIHRLDREIDYLRECGLLAPQTGFQPTAPVLMDIQVLLTPSALALHMYVRCQGSRQSPTEFFGIGQPMFAETMQR
jgi:hypothetical protein